MTNAAPTEAQPTSTWTKGNTMKHIQIKSLKGQMDKSCSLYSGLVRQAKRQSHRRERREGRNEIREALLQP